MRIENNLFEDFQNDASTVRKVHANGFEAFFKAAMGLLNETNAYQIDADNSLIDFVTGKNDDMIALNMALSRASNSIQFTSQVTSKVLAAYQEIMRMQI